jgi:hypothetical protein
MPMVPWLVPVHLEPLGVLPESAEGLAHAGERMSMSEKIGGWTAQEWIEWSAEGYGRMCHPERFVALVTLAFAQPPARPLADPTETKSIALTNST